MINCRNCPNFPSPIKGEQWTVFRKDENRGTHLCVANKIMKYNMLLFIWQPIFEGPACQQIKKLKD